MAKNQSKKCKINSPGRKISILDKFLPSQPNRIVVNKEFWSSAKNYYRVKESQNLGNCLALTSTFLVYGNGFEVSACHLRKLSHDISVFYFRI